jgi:hypothetical protein
MTVRLLLLVSLLAIGACSRGAPPAAAVETASTATSRLLPDAARLADVSPELRQRLEGSPLALFRFVNRAWTGEVCEAFVAERPALPRVRLHGDAHIEQYAVTANARGLDDFDDSATGPAVIDLVRFLGSLELTAHERGWLTSVPAIADAFLDGYMRALANPSYFPGDPAVVARLRASAPPSPAAFLTWADAQMQPLAPADATKLDQAWAEVERHAAAADPGFTAAFLARKRAGTLRLGIGSALTKKFLLRLEGPSAAAEDDVIVEAKEVSELGNQPCLGTPPGREAFRVVEGVQQIGRLKHRLLLTLPEFQGQGNDAPGWWIKTWDRSYRELELPDLRNADELREVAHDAGAQLGSSNVASLAADAADRRLELEGARRLRARVLDVAHQLTGALIAAWERLRAR